MNTFPHLKRPKEFDTPEFLLLAACAYYSTKYWTEQRGKVHAALLKHPDPIKFKALVNRHRLPALVTKVLTRTGEEIGQDLTAFSLPNEGRRTAIKNLALHGEFLRLQTAFSIANIQMMPLKGTMLSQRLYGDIGLRQMKDIDLLVKPDKLFSSLDLLAKNGYQINLHPNLFKKKDLVLKRWWHIECYQPVLKIHLELHWRFERVQDVAQESKWWSWLEPSDPQDEIIFEFLFLCLHGASHGWSRLKWLGDVMVLMERFNDNEWQKTLELSSSLKMNEIVAQVIYLSWEIFSPTWKHKFATEISSNHKKIWFIITNAHDHIISNEGSYYDKVIRNLYLQAHMGYRYSIRENFNFWHLFLSAHPDDLVLMRLPNWMSWLYIILRPLTFTFRWLRRR